jgi:hypothetical protein
MSTPMDRVKVRLVVREVERYERVVEMPRGLFELNRDRLAQAGPDVVGDVACLLVDCFADHEHDELTEHTEIEVFELADPLDAEPVLQVFDGAFAADAALAVGTELDPLSLEQGDVL